MKLEKQLVKEFESDTVSIPKGFLKSLGFVELNIGPCNFMVDTNHSAKLDKFSSIVKTTYNQIELQKN